MVKEDSMFLAGGVQENLNMSFGARMLSGSPREASWGVQSAADKGVWSREGRYLKLICVQAVVESVSRGEPVFRE